MTAEQGSAGIGSAGQPVDRRSLLTKALGTIAILSVGARKAKAEKGSGLYKCGRYVGEPPTHLVSDIACGTSTSHGGQFADLACGKAINVQFPAPENEVAQDFDCAQQQDGDCGGLYSEGTGARHSDQDCERTAEDADCGKPAYTGVGGTWQDQDCAMTAEDADCGNPAGVGGSWSDQDCTSSSTDPVADADCSLFNPQGLRWSDEDCPQSQQDSNNP
jgi:hypothetical protein